MSTTLEEMEKLDDLVAENNRLIIEETGGLPLQETEEEARLSKIRMRAIKEAFSDGVILTQEEIFAIN